MKLLIVTQAVDENDPVLGFFTNWLAVFATRFSRIEVICLREGKHALPENVRIWSLGKEKTARESARADVLSDMIYHITRRIVFSFRFVSLVWRLRHEYDAVLVHMNPEYVILGGAWWRAAGKKVALWYNHPHKGVRFTLAALLANKLFYTSPYAAPAGRAKAIRMPAGIDTMLFSPPSSSAKRERALVYVQGRVAPSKRVDAMLRAVRTLREKIPAARIVLAGPVDPNYDEMLRWEFEDLVKANALTFAGSVPNAKSPANFSAAGVSMNLAASGHFDKSVLEALACETPVIVSSKAFAGIIPPRLTVPENDAAALAKALSAVITMPEVEYHELGVTLRSAVVDTQSLDKLADALATTMAI